MKNQVFTENELGKNIVNISMQHVNTQIIIEYISRIPRAHPSKTEKELLSSILY